MANILRSPLGFLTSYLVLMIPTYLLPYVGSNSSIINGVSAIFGRGPTPQWWMHFWCLFMLILIANVRGRLVGKPYLLVFPILALVFDLTPGLSSIPLVPTLMHLLCLILGAIGAVPEATDSTEPAVFPNTARTAAGVSVLSIAGMLWFAVGLGASTNYAKQHTPLPPAAAPSAPSAAIVAGALPAQGLPEPAQAPEASPLKPSTAVATQSTTKPHKPSESPAASSSTRTEKPTVRMINIHEP